MHEGSPECSVTCWLSFYKKQIRKKRKKNQWRKNRIEENRKYEKKRGKSRREQIGEKIKEKKRLILEGKRRDLHYKYAVFLLLFCDNKVPYTLNVCIFF